MEVCPLFSTKYSGKSDKQDTIGLYILQKYYKKINKMHIVISQPYKSGIAEKGGTV